MPFAAIGAALGISGSAVAGLAAGAAGIGSALIGSSAASSAANTEANAANNATNAELSMFNQTQANLAPYMQAGGVSLEALMKSLGLAPGATGLSGVANGSLTQPFTAAQYQQSPGYAFQMQQGIDAIDNSAAAKGGVFSGNTLKALTQYGQGLANSDYQQAYNNYTGQQNQIFNMLQNLTGSGQNAAAGLGSLGSNVAGQVGSNIMNAGNAQAAGTVAGASALNNGLNSVLTNQAFLNAMKGIFSGSGSGQTSGADWGYT